MNVLDLKEGMRAVMLGFTNLSNIRSRNVRNSTKKAKGLGYQKIIIASNELRVVKALNGVDD